MDLLAQPLRTAEFLAVDTETNGLGGDRCEVTEVGAVLVGGGELHDRFASLCAVRAPLSRGVQEQANGASVATPRQFILSTLAPPGINAYQTANSRGSLQYLVVACPMVDY